MKRSCGDIRNREEAQEQDGIANGDRVVPVSDAGPLSARQGALLPSRGLGGSREQDAGAVDLYLLSQRTGHKDLKFMQSGEGFRVAKRYDGHTKNYTYEASPS